MGILNLFKDVRLEIYFDEYFLTTEFENISFLVLKMEMVRDKRKKGIKKLKF